MIYLASPYTHPRPLIMRERTRLTARVAARLALQGEMVYAPVVHGHALHIATKSNRKIPYNYWVAHGMEMLEFCRSLYILITPGWDTSDGVAAELAAAYHQRKPVLYINEAAVIVEPRDARTA